MRDEVEEFGGAEAVLAGGDGGVEGAGEDFAAHSGFEGVGVEGVAGEVALHEGVVLAGDGLDEAVVGGAGVGERGGVAVGVAGEEVDAAVGPAVVEDGQEERAEGVRAQLEGVVAGGEDVVEAGAGDVEFGDGDGAGDALGGALAPQGAGGGGDRVGGGDDEDGRVGGVQGGAQVRGEVGVAGRVDQVDLDALPFEREQGELDGALLLVLDLLVVGDGGAVGDATGPAGGAGGEGEGFGEGGLAHTAGTDEDDVAQVPGAGDGGCLAGSCRAAVGHRGLLPWRRGCPSQSRVGCRPGACRVTVRAWAVAGVAVRRCVRRSVSSAWLRWVRRTG